MDFRFTVEDFLFTFWLLRLHCSMLTQKREEVNNILTFGFSSHLLDFLLTFEDFFLTFEDFFLTFWNLFSPLCRKTVAA